MQLSAVGPHRAVGRVSASPGSSQRQALKRALLALLGPPTMYALKPLLGEKRHQIGRDQASRFMNGLVRSFGTSAAAMFVTQSR